MSTSMLATPLTARVFLFPDERTGGGAPSLRRSLGERGVGRATVQRVRHLSHSGLDAVDDEIGRVAEGLMEIDLGDALVAGWRKHSSLTESARRTLATPGSEEVVVLATHKVTSTYRPSVDLLVDGVRLNSFEFELTVEFDVKGLSAVVRGGALVALRGGECLVAARVSLEGARLAERERYLEVGLLVPLDRPVPLVDKAALIPGQDRSDASKQQETGRARPRHS